MPTGRLLGALALGTLVAAGCSHHAAGGARVERSPRVTLSPPDGAPAVTVNVELARSPEEQARGLMFRERLDPGAGMLFLNDAPRPLSFWMHNTYIPLDMIFIDGGRRVLGVVENAEPLTDDPRSVPGAAQFVLEVVGGFAAKHRIAPGTRCTFLDVD